MLPQRRDFREKMKRLRVLLLLPVRREGPLGIDSCCQQREKRNGQKGKCVEWEMVGRNGKVFGKVIST